MGNLLGTRPGRTEFWNPLFKKANNGLDRDWSGDAFPTPRLRRPNRYGGIRRPQKSRAQWKPNFWWVEVSSAVRLRKVAWSLRPRVLSDQTSEAKETSGDNITYMMTKSTYVLLH